MEHLGEICQAHGVRVLVLDVGEGGKTVPNAALNALAAKTGGAWVRQAKALGPHVAMVAPPDEQVLATARACTGRGQGSRSGASRGQCRP